MDSFPDFSQHGYAVEKELGANRSGGRVTYLAVERDRDRPVVIKQFQFAKSVSSWSAYDAHHREIDVLRDLDHKGIPRYLSSFQVTDGFCMVQEYKPARPLSVHRSFAAEEIKIIAVKVLEILIYLQNRIPPIIHRDLKPDNILVDSDLNVFLVDFGFAHVGEGEVGVSSVVKGTLGFMPPEQLFNRQLTEASDLYGLGMTLICLLTQTRSDDIGSLVDISYKIKFRHLVPKLNIHWVKWLEKMAEPRLSDRYANARAALQALPATPLQPPEVQLSTAIVNLRADVVDQSLSHSISVINLVPEVMLTGRWEVRPHPHDPQLAGGNHAWIAVTPAEFTCNHLDCTIQVETRKLRAGSTYRRTLLLHTNAFPQSYPLDLCVQTASLPVSMSARSRYPLMGLFFLVLIVFRVLVGAAFPIDRPPNEIWVATGGFLLGGTGGLQCAAWTLQSAKMITGSRLASSVAILLAVPTLVGIWVFLERLSSSWDGVLAGLIPGLMGGWLLGMGMGMAVKKLLDQSITQAEAAALAILTSALAIASAIGWVRGFGHGSLILSIAVMALGLGSLGAIAPLRDAQSVAAYRRREGDRVRPD